MLRSVICHLLWNKWNNRQQVVNNAARTCISAFCVTLLSNVFVHSLFFFHFCIIFYIHMNYFNMTQREKCFQFVFNSYAEVRRWEAQSEVY